MCLMVEVQAAYLDFTVALPLQYGILAIDTTPVKGEVFVGGVSQGIAPVSMSVVAGSYVISFGDVEGYTKPSQIIKTVTADQESKVLGTYVAVDGSKAWLPYALLGGGAVVLVMGLAASGKKK